MGRAVYCPIQYLKQQYQKFSQRTPVHLCDRDIMGTLWHLGLCQTFVGVRVKKAATQGSQYIKLLVSLWRQW